MPVYFYIGVHDVTKISVYLSAKEQIQLAVEECLTEPSLRDREYVLNSAALIA